MTTIVQARSADAHLDASGRQVVEITVHRGYRPSSVRARAGLPLRVVFRRDDDDACTERVVFSAPRLERRLTGPITTVDLPAQPCGEVRYTCAMGRYRGHIRFVGPGRRRFGGSPARMIARLDEPVRTGLVLWLCTLPLIAALGVAMVGIATAVALAALGLVFWIAGCVWAFRDWRPPR